MTNILNIVNNILICIVCNQPMQSTGIYSETPVHYNLTIEGHHHDDNCKGYYYICPSNHIKQVFIQRKCEELMPCNWKGKTNCFCHSELKINKLPIMPPNQTNRNINMKELLKIQNQ